MKNNDMLGNIERMGEITGTYWILVRNLRERDHLEDLGIHVRII